MCGAVFCGDDVRSVFTRPGPANLLDRISADSGTDAAGRRIDASFAGFRAASPAPSAERQDNQQMDYRPRRAVLRISLSRSLIACLCRLASASMNSR